MPTKRLYVLANSVKHGHCVAGLEIVEPKAVISYAGWIRPISHHGEGELNNAECSYKNAGVVQIFDIVDIHLQQCAGTLAQPENWLIDPTKHWVKVAAYDDDDLPQLVPDAPPDLWLANFGRTDRISPAALAGLNRTAIASNSSAVFLVAGKRQVA